MEWGQDGTATRTVDRNLCQQYVALYPTPNNWIIASPVTGEMFINQIANPERHVAREWLERAGWRDQEEIKKMVQVDAENIVTPRRYILQGGKQRTFCWRNGRLLDK